MKTTTITVNGMHCASCEALLKDALQDVKGVTSATVSLKAGNAVVTHDESVSPATIRKAIEAEGYKTA